MANLRVKMKGTPSIAEMQAEAIEDGKTQSDLPANDTKSQVTAHFDLKNVNGWWIEPHTEKQSQAAELYERIKCGRESAGNRTGYTEDVEDR